MATAKILTDGSTQIMVIPSELHLNCSEVEISKVGSELRLSPKSEKSPETGFDKFMRSVSELGGFSDDLIETIEDARRNEVPSKREEL